VIENEENVMLKRTLLIGFVVACSASSFAQGVCSSPSNKLVCVLPQLYSTSGGVNLPNAAHKAHFDTDFEQNAAALNAAVGTELTSLRLASPASGLIFTFDKAAGIVRPTTESFGPILGERAETIGRHRLFVAATYQYFPFSSLDGINLKHVPAVYRHADTLNPDGTHRQPTDPASPGDPGVELEYITTSNRIDLKVHEVTFYATYGLTSRVDVSVAIPVLNVRMGATSNATIVRTADTIVQPVPASAYQANPNSFLGRLYASTGPAANCAQTLTCSGYFHYFSESDPAGSLNATFASAKTATGIGDVVFRAKATVLKRERAAVAIGADLRVPTGDENNFLGSGATGFKPFVAASYRARISPHVNLGYEVNGTSVLAGNATTGEKRGLPNQFFYSAGVDTKVTRKLTAAVDLLGQRLSDAPRVVQGSFVDVQGNTHPDIAQTTSTRASFTMNDLAIGAKYELASKLLLTGNIQIKLDDGGLRAKVSPLIGLSYTF
jgi:hypothetical protein